MVPEFIALNEILGVEYTVKTLGSIDNTRGVRLQGLFGAKRDRLEVLILLMDLMRY